MRLAYPTPSARTSVAHTAACTARAGVGFQPVPTAVVIECAIPAGKTVARQPSVP